VLKIHLKEFKMNVDFCNSKAYLVDSDDLREKIMLECDALFGFKLKRGYFPGSQPVAVERKDLENLKSGYMVCEKTDGERAVLLLININNKPMCFIINRNNELYFMDLSFKKEVFEGSVFDGEIIKTKKGTWNYLIHDCMVYNGRTFMESSHEIRYACIIDLILKRYQNKEADCINIKTKLFYHFGPEIEKTWEHIKQTTENKIDGLIFTPLNKPIKLGRDYSLFKWKSINTIDFLVKKNGKKIELIYDKNKIFKSFGVGNINYKTINNFLKENNKGDCVIEFKYLPDEELFTPYKVRTDKNHPNSEITLVNTIKNIEEDIKIENIYLNPAPSTDIHLHLANLGLH
jgi:hypothetical protein